MRSIVAASFATTAGRRKFGRTAVISSRRSVSGASAAAVVQASRQSASGPLMSFRLSSAMSVRSQPVCSARRARSRWYANVAGMRSSSTLRSQPPNTGIQKPKRASSPGSREALRRRADPFDLARRLEMELHGHRPPVVRAGPQALADPFDHPALEVRQRDPRRTLRDDREQLLPDDLVLRALDVPPFLPRHPLAQLDARVSHGDPPRRWFWSARAVVLPGRALVLDELGQRTRIVGVPDRVDDLARCGEERTLARQHGVVALVDPAQPVAHRPGALAASDRLGVREPGQIDAARDRKADPFPDPRVHVQKQVLLARGVPDELDLADAVIAEGAQDRRPALGDGGDLLPHHQAGRAEALGILLELAADERAAHFAVGGDERAERIEPAWRDVDDLLRHAREVGRLVREAKKLRGVRGAKDLHPEAIVETALLGWLDDRRVADLARRGRGLVERESARYRDAQVMRVRIETALVKDRVDDCELAERDAVAPRQPVAVAGHGQDPFVVRGEEHRSFAEPVHVRDEIVGEAPLVLERVRAGVALGDRAGRLTQAARIRIERDHLDPVRGERSGDSETGDV